MDAAFETFVRAAWSGIRGLPRSLSDDGEDPIAEDVLLGWTLGVRVRRRVRVWEPRQRGTQWVCPLDIEGRTGGPVDIPGGSAVECLVLAARALWLFLFDSPTWFDAERWGGERAPMDVLCFQPDDPPSEPWTPIAISWLQDAGGPRRVRIGRPVEAPNGAWWAVYGLGRGTELQTVSGDTPLMVLAYIGGAVAGAFLDGVTDATLPGYAAFTGVLWQGLGTAAPWAEHEPPWIEERAIRHDGGPEVLVRLWAPRETPTGWTCAVFVGTRTERPIAVGGDGPITALISAWRVLKRFDDDWGPNWMLDTEDEDETDPEEEPELSWEEHLALVDACRARPIDPAAVRDVQEQVLAFRDTSVRVFLGACHGDSPLWYCPIWTDRMAGPRHVSSQTTRMEAFRLAMSVLTHHLHRGLPDLSVRSE